MYESITYDVILQRMLDAVPNTVDKREGSVIYNALSPAAIELQLMYIEADTILNETFADTASRTYLIKRAAERGITPSVASNAILKGIFNINVPIGSRFSLGSLNYIVTEQIADFQFKLKCETSGSEGNLQTGSLIPIDYIDGLGSATLTEVLIPGEDDEDTEVFRSRYFESFDSQSFGGNIADYKEKTNALDGVTGTKVYPVWNGGGTVKLVILDSSFGVPSGALITAVQTAVDPVASAGDGKGFAPIGHVVTVVGITETIVNISMVITYQAGWTWAAIQANVQSMIDAYFLELKKTWQDNNNLIVRISQIESRMLNISGVIDVAGTTLNGAAANLTIAADCVPKRGTVSG